MLGYTVFANKCDPFLTGLLCLYTIISSIEINHVQKIIRNYSFSQPTIFFKILFSVGGQLLYNIVLVPAIHQHESVIGIHTSPPSTTSLPIPPTGCFCPVLQ